MNRLPLYQAVLLGTSLISAAAVAQENNSSDPQTLETIVVSATRSAQSENVAPTMISIIDSAQIARSNASSLADVLRSSGMVQVRDITGDGNRVSVSMRGFGQNTSNNVLILVDGRRLNNPTLAAPRLSSVSVEEIERIEITHGSAGSLYGEQAVGGVINIITKTSTEAHGSIQVSAGSYDANSVQANLSQSYDNGIGIRLSGKHAVSDGYRDNNDSEFDTYTGKLSYRHDSGELFIEKQKVDDDLRLPGSLNNAELATDRRQSTSDDFSNGSTDVITLGIDQQLTENLSLLVEYSDRDLHSYGYLGSNFIQDMEVHSFTPRISGEWSTSRGTLYLTGGYDQIHSDYKSLWSGTGWSSSSKYKQEVKAYYFQSIIPIQKDLNLTLGARHSQVENTDRISVNRNQDESATVKEIGLSWQFNQEQRIFIRRDENFRFANLDEYTYTSGGFLDPQTGTSWELGWEHNDNRAHYAASLYQLDLKDEIAYDPTLYANVNLDDSQRQGLIFELSRTLTPSLKAGATYTYTDAELTSGSFDGNKVPFVAEHTLNLFTDYQFSNNWSLFIDGQYTGSRYQDDDNTNDQHKVPEQFILNTSINYQRNNWFGSLKVNNITNEKYDGYTIYNYLGSNHYPAPERNLKLTAGYRF
nr:TonB-dependent receptor [uncultured Amphritea sp.]